MDPKKEALRQEALEFCRLALGKESLSFLQQEEIWQAVVERMSPDIGLQDATLGVIHRAAPENNKLAEEFIAYLTKQVLHISHGRLSPGLRLLYDTEDLVQSMFCDFGIDLFQLEFRTRAQFLTYLSRTVDWKIKNKVKKSQARKRREDLRVNQELQELGEESPEPDPAENAMARELERRVKRAFQKLNRSDQEILTMFTEECNYGAVAEFFSLSMDHARLKVNRALERWRRLMRE
ncbi:MAG: sigma-70 family RNA polymerase sigma factor [Planctomycetota bacterium]|nr:MAG: sigma-70 family RNA polymerase sigma factor [Planctomycetota bacterium]